MTSEIDKLKHFHVKNKHIENCPDCLKGIRLKDVTVELEEEAYKEMRNNK